MLRWRLLLGAIFIGALAGLCWLDVQAATPGIWLMPLALLLAILASQEVIGLCRAGGLQPSAGAVYLGNFLIVASNWAPWPVGHEGRLSQVQPLHGPLLVLGIGTLAAFLGAMRRYEKPGGSTANVAATILALVYVGFMLWFVVQLRLVWGMGALVSLLVVVKMGDTGAYAIGRLFGRHKMTPVLSPGKTLEGAVGALIFSMASSWAVFEWIVPRLVHDNVGKAPAWGWAVFGLVVGLVGVLGDLAESLLKRDVGRKDSSQWMPGFGGVLDILDAVLLAAPVAWALWLFGVVGR
jgi:phosphatidate cytidylyltransferase